MKVFHMEKEEAFPLNWEGDIVLKRPCSFTEEEYHTYFNEQMISLEDLNRYMSEPDFSIFHRVPAWVLKDEYKEKIKNDIINGQVLSDEEGIPKWTLDYRSKDEDGGYWDFTELKPNHQKNVVDWMMEPKNGVCKGSTVGVATMDYRLRFDEPEQEGSKLVGKVTLECSPVPQECEYVRDSEGISLRPIEDSKTLTALPPKIEQYAEDIHEFAEEYCEQFGRSLDDVLGEAEDIQEAQPSCSQFRINDDYWSR